MPDTREIVPAHRYRKLMHGGDIEIEDGAPSRAPSHTRQYNLLERIAARELVQRD
jgi:hypothetical protein